MTDFQRKLIKQKLVNNRKMYAKNYSLMEFYELIGSKKRHKEKCVRENALHLKQVQLMKELGIYVKDPCYRRSKSSCEKCSGYYKKVNGLSWCTDNLKFRKSDKDDPKGIRCHLKHMRGLL